MADSNPFTEVEIDSSGPDALKNDDREKSPDSSIDTDSVSLEIIAIKLIKENLILTALELHTELLERGRELNKLRDYFSNPANFEQVKAFNSDQNNSPGLGRLSGSAS